MSEISHDIKRFTEVNLTLIELLELLNVILHSLISFPGIPSADITAKIRSLMGLFKTAL